MSVTLARSAGLISVATMASRVLGVAREMVLAAFFGASGGMEMDAFNVAFRIPNLLRDLFAEGAMTAAFVPTFTRALTTEGRDAAWHLGNLVVNALLLITGVLVLIGIVFASPITHAFAPSFADTPGQARADDRTDAHHAAVSRHRCRRGRDDGHAQLAAAVLRARVVAGDVQRGHDPLRVSPRAGDAAAPACRRLWQLPSARLSAALDRSRCNGRCCERKDFDTTPVVDFTDPKLREVLRLMVPGTLGLAAVQINVFVNTYLATSQEQGAVSWLNYAFRLMYLPIGLFGVSIATAALPEIARARRRG